MSSYKQCLQATTVQSAKEVLGNAGVAAQVVQASVALRRQRAVAGLRSDFREKLLRLEREERLGAHDVERPLDASDRRRRVGAQEAGGVPQRLDSVAMPNPKKAITPPRGAAHPTARHTTTPWAHTASHLSK